MIDLKKVKTGEYVIVTAPFHDYGKVGTVFRIIDTNIPGEPSSAVGWMINKETGLVDGGGYSYKLPQDKVEIMPRKELAAILRKSLKKIQSKLDGVRKEYEVLHERIDFLESYTSREEEVNELLKSALSFF